MTNHKERRRVTTSLLAFPVLAGCGEGLSSLGGSTTNSDAGPIGVASNSQKDVPTPDCTVVPTQASSITANDNAIWTLVGGVVLRNGVAPSVDPTHDVEAIVAKNGILYLQYQGNFYGHPMIRSSWPSPAGTWSTSAVGRPCPISVTQDCTVVPAASAGLMTSDGAVWTLAGGVVRRNGAAPSVDPTHDVEAIVAKSGTIYLRYQGSFYGHPAIRSSWPSPAGTWATSGVGDPCPLSITPDCTVVPTMASSLTASDGATWTLSGGVVLRNGVAPSADPTHDVEAIVVKSDVVYLKYLDNYYGHPAIRASWPSPAGTWGSVGVPNPCSFVVSPDCTVVPTAASSLTASDGAVWTLSGGVVLRNGVAPSVDPTHDVEAIVAKSGTVYLRYLGNYYGHPAIRSTWPSPAGTWSSVAASNPCSAGQVISSTDSRVFTWLDPRATFAANASPTDGRAHLINQVNFSLISGSDRNYPAGGGGGYVLDSIADPGNSARRSYYHRIGPLAPASYSANTYRSGFGTFGGSSGLQPGQTYWLAFEIKPRASAVMQGVGDLAWFDLHADSSVPGPSPFSMFSDSHNVWALYVRTGPGNGTGGALTNVANIQSITAGIRYKFVIQMKPHWNLSANPFLHVWLQRDAGTVEHIVDQPLIAFGYPDAPVSMHFKLSLYHFPQNTPPTWSMPSDRVEAESKGLYIFHEGSGTPTLNATNLLALLDSI